MLVTPPWLTMSSPDASFIGRPCDHDWPSSSEYTTHIVFGLR